MTDVNPSIFKAYDIRGVYEKDFDVHFAHQVGNKISQSLGKTIIVGGDSRASSRELRQAVIDGVMETGGTVIDIGECSTPLFYFSVRQSHADGGIMITASHNTDEYNGFKIVGKEAVLIGGSQVSEFFAKNSIVEQPGGQVQQKDFTLEYIEKIMRAAGSMTTGIVGVDAPGMVQKNLAILASKVGITLASKEHDGLVATFDPDGDRISFTEHGQKIPADYVMLLLVEKLRPKKVVYGINLSHAIREHLVRWDVAGVPSRIGRLYIHEAMQQSQADLGGEFSGHYYFKSFGYLEAPELVLLLVLQIAQRGKLIDLIKPYQTYFRSDEISFPLDLKVFARLKEHYPDGVVSEMDGLSIEYPDYWFLLRTSNTEPLMRFVVEAKSKQLLELKVAELKEIITLQ